MKSRALSVTALILLTPLVVLAFQAQADRVHKRVPQEQTIYRRSLEDNSYRILRWRFRSPLWLHQY